MTWTQWYDSLAKPSWTPAPATIRLVWTILHPIILVSFGFVLVQAFRRKQPGPVAPPFAVNVVANLLFMPVFAGLRDVPLAAADILVVWATLAWCVAAVWPAGSPSPNCRTSCGCPSPRCCNYRSRR